MHYSGKDNNGSNEVYDIQQLILPEDLPQHVSLIVQLYSGQ
jgi:hypothetical protein